MTQDDFSLHFTLTTPISGGDRDGWDFSCESCGYHARYMLGDDHTQYKLEILDAGDPHTRHVGPYSPPAPLSIYGELTHGLDSPRRLEKEEPQQIPFDEEAWLTPELREKLRLILDRLDD